MLRLGVRHGLSARVDAADLPAFHDLYALTARHFGTPVFPRRFFAALLEHLGDQAALMTVRLGSTPAAAALMFHFGDVILPYYAGARRDLFRYAVTDFLYWQVMRYGRARGAREFDFGRSKAGTGAFEFKRLWGCEALPLTYRVCRFDSRVPEGRSTADGQLRWLQACWRRLPLPVTKQLGPFFAARWGAYFT
jgi:hypothetical protein